MPRIFGRFFIYAELVENYIKSTVLGRKYENLCHTTVLEMARIGPYHQREQINGLLWWNDDDHVSLAMECRELLSATILKKMRYFLLQNVLRE